MKNILDEKPLVFTIDNLYSKAQCDSLIEATEKLGFEIAPITVGDQVFEYKLDHRNNDRVIVDDTTLADELFKDLKDYLPPEFKGWHLLKLNNRFRFYRYTKDQKFSPHWDGRYKESLDVESRLTLLIYLSDGVEGGETSFFTEDSDLRFKVTPTIGQVLVFDHHQLHSGEPVIDGYKYVLRTDVMYSRFKPN